MDDVENEKKGIKEREGRVKDRRRERDKFEEVKERGEEEWKMEIDRNLKKRRRTG